MSSLERFDRDGVELLINTKTGESFASIAGYARMANKPYQTIYSRVQRYESDSSNPPLERVQIQTERGLQWLALIPGKKATSWLISDNPSLLANMSEGGWNLYCHQLAGFKVTSTAVSDTTNSQILGAITQLTGELGIIKKQIAQLQGTVAEQQQELFEYEADAVETQLVYQKYPGWGEAIESQKNFQGEDAYFPLKTYTFFLGYHELTHGERSSIGRLFTNFLRFGLTKEPMKAGRTTLYPMSCLELCKLAIELVVNR